MKIDINAIKNKIAKMNERDGVSASTSGIQTWKPGPGKYVVRGLYWPEKFNLVNPGEPFVERWFYYNIVKYGILAPEQFKKEDPVHDLRMKLFATKQPQDKEIAKQLFPRMRSFMPVVVKEGPNANPVQPLVWSFSEYNYKKLIGYFADADIGDYLDYENGFDIIVDITRKPGKPFNDIDINLARKSSKLADSQETIDAITEKIPDISSMHEQKTTAEISVLLNAWLQGDSEDTSSGMERDVGATSSAVDGLDDLVNDIESSKKQKPAKAKVDEDIDFDSPPKKKTQKEKTEPSDDLDAAFDDLME